MTDPTQRFSDRVQDYVRYRPSYPAEAIDAVLEAAPIDVGGALADVGSGTGISAKLFLERGYRVHCVEPNKEMRAAAEGELASFGGFHSVDGTAEHTGLPDACVGLAVAAQSFHWFRREEARTELRRVVAAPHCMAILWNERLTDTAFLGAYEELLLRAATDYAHVDHRNVGREALVSFFRSFETLTFPNAQRLDRKGFLGRAWSSSYVPRSEEMRRALEELFERHAVDGHVDFRYLTSVHVGTL